MKSNSRLRASYAPPRVQAFRLAPQSVLCFSTDDFESFDGGDDITWSGAGAMEGEEVLPMGGLL